MNTTIRWLLGCFAASALFATAAIGQETTTRYKTAVPAPVVTAPVQTVDAARARLSSVQMAIATLDAQIAKPAPKELDAAQLAEWKEHGDWLSTVRERFANFLAENGGAFGDSAGLRTAGSDLTKQMAEMNMQFLKLQEVTQTESRRFTTLSNASKARHEVAMNAIRNLK